MRQKNSGLTLDDLVQRGCASPRMAYELPKDRVKALKERKEPLHGSLELTIYEGRSM